MTVPPAAYFQIPPEQRAAAAVTMFDCPFCGASRGVACHVRTSAAQLPWPHKRRFMEYAATFAAGNHPSSRADSASDTDPDTRIRRALDALDATGWTHSQRTQVALALESVVRQPAAGRTGFRPYVVK